MKKLILIFLLLPFCLFTQNKNTLYTNLDQLIENTVDPSRPGLIVNVYSETHDLDWSKSYGINDISESNLLEKFDQFRIASVTKTFVAAVILRLWEDGKINLDNPISKYISEEHSNILSKGDYDPNSITVRHLLNHSSGMYDHTIHPNFLKKISENPLHKWTRTEQINACMEWGEPVGLIGKQFQYSDTGYVILGEIIENITKLNLDIAMKNLLRFEKLNINKTWFEDNRIDRRIHQYFGNDRDIYNIDPSIDYFGGGGLISTAKDLSKFYYLLFNNKVFNNESTLKEMIKKYNYETTAEIDYSLGIWEIKLDDTKFYTHSGYWGTQVVYSPKNDISISVNYSEGWSGSNNAPILEKIFSIILNNYVEKI
jgi:D-alanyl-D-alanine carboxypeptidase